MIDLSGRVALVTGASRGIGRETALLLARAGADVAVGFRKNEASAREVVARIRQAGRRAVALQGDVRRRTDQGRLFDRAREVLGGLGVVVANAGIWRRAPIDRMSQRQLQETLDSNLKSAFLTAQLAIREMKRSGGGSLILVSSTAGQRGEPFYSHYAASKGALIALTKSLAVEVAGLGIRVNCVAPGWVETDMTAHLFARTSFRKAVQASTPLQRTAAAEDIAGPILFLASDLARHVHGEVLNVNGGSVLCG